MIVNNKIQEFLAKEGLRKISVLHYSDWKKTIVLKVERQNTFFVLKACDENSPKEIKLKFKKELNFLLLSDSKYLPKLIAHEENIMCMEYIEGKSMREMVLENALSSNLIDILIKSYSEMYGSLRQEGKHALKFANAFDNLSSLGQSGPFQSSKLNFTDRIINKVLVQILKYRLRGVLAQINESKLRTGFYHGDFHYNNIFITKSNQIKVIDFENQGYEGCFDFDLLYLSIMISNYLKEEKEIIEFEGKLFSFLEDNEALKKVFFLYKSAILINPRFGSKTKGIREKVKLVLLKYY